MATSKLNLNGIKTGRAIQALETATAQTGQQGEATPQEIADRRESLQTQGRKGAKAIRINMAFTPANHEFIRIMANASGKSMTQFTNLVIAAYRREHPEIMEQAQQFLDTINSGAFSSLLDGNGEN